MARSIGQKFVALAAVAGCWFAGLAAQELTLPLTPDSVRFAVIGDNGTGETPQYDVGRQLAASHQKFPFSFVIMMGDNLYGAERPQDFVNKFEAPYKALLDAKVDFYATLGNHDDPNVSTSRSTWRASATTPSGRATTCGSSSWTAPTWTPCNSAGSSRS